MNRSCYLVRYELVSTVENTNRIDLESTEMEEIIDINKLLTFKREKEKLAPYGYKVEILFISRVSVEYHSDIPEETN